MNKDKIDAMYELLIATSDAVERDRQNLKIFEAELNKLNGNLAATKMINNILVGSLAAASNEFKTSLKFCLEQILSCDHELPGDFETQAKKLLSAVCGEPVKEPEKPHLVLFRSEKKDDE
jgi:hypothetical protein